MLTEIIQKQLHEYEPLLSFLMSMQEYVHENKIPKEMVLFTAEFLYFPGRMSEIILLIADESTHLGRKERYEDCIFSHYVENIGETIVINDVKNHPAFLELEPRINSEVFCEQTITADLSLILNMECSSELVSEEAFLWFGQMRAGMSGNRL
jgi:hypothetical protein